jgi:hypothetical protein
MKIKVWMLMECHTREDGTVQRKLYRKNGTLFVGTELQARDQASRPYMPSTYPVRATINVVVEK